MNRTLFALLVLLGVCIIAALCSCEKQEDITEPVVASVIIYGRNACGLTTSLKKACDKDTIAYTYCDIDSDGNCMNNLWVVVGKFNLGKGGVVGLPVVSITKGEKEYGLERPSVNDIKKLIN